MPKKPIQKLPKKNHTARNAALIAGGVVAAAAAGAAAGLLLSPHSGKENRKRIAEGSRKTVRKVKKTAKQALKKGEEILPSVKKEAVRFTKNASVLAQKAEKKVLALRPSKKIVKTPSKKTQKKRSRKK